MFDALLFIAEHEHMSLLDALTEAHDQGVIDNGTTWIPIDKEPPAIHQAVYVTCKAAGRKNWVAQTTYRGSWDIPIVKTGDAKVIAWMPFTIPAPYIGGTDDKTD